LSTDQKKKAINLWMELSQLPCFTKCNVGILSFVLTNCGKWKGKRD